MGREADTAGLTSAARRVACGAGVTLVVAFNACGRAPVHWAQSESASDGTGGGPTSQVIADWLVAAEQEGAAFPRDSVLSTYPSYPFPGEVQIVGTDARKCVEVPAEPSTQVRSGEFIAGGYLHQLVFGRPLKLWWRPINSTEGMTLLVRGRLLEPPYDSIRYESSDIIAPLDSRTRQPIAAEGTFPPGMQVPVAGPWLMVTTSGNNWGCFVVRVRPEDSGGVPR